MLKYDKTSHKYKDTKSEKVALLGGKKIRYTKASILCSHLAYECGYITTPKGRFNILRHDYYVTTCNRIRYVQYWVIDPSNGNAICCSLMWVLYKDVPSMCNRNTNRVITYSQHGIDICANDLLVSEGWGILNSHMACVNAGLVIGDEIGQLARIHTALRYRGLGLAANLVNFSTHRLQAFVTKNLYLEPQPYADSSSSLGIIVQHDGYSAKEYDSLVKLYKKCGYSEYAVNGREQKYLRNTGASSAKSAVKYMQSGKEIPFVLDAKQRRIELELFEASKHW